MGNPSDYVPVEPTTSLADWQPTAIVIDDQSTNRYLIVEILNSVIPQGNIIDFASPLTALDFCHNHHIDLVCTDYQMPGMNGVDFIRKLRSMPHLTEVPIICLTANDNRIVRYEALDAGANDYLPRPIDHRECAARFRNLLSMRKYQLSARRQSIILAERVAQVTTKLEQTQMEMLLRLATVAEQRDTDTGEHLVRIGKYAALLAQKFTGDAAFAALVEAAAPLHDVGKVAIPDTILLAARPLTSAEWEIMCTHTTIGHLMLDGGESRHLRVAAEIARWHHERFDGGGYPDRLRGNQIPLSARIVATADIYDALISRRPYKLAWSPLEAQEYLRTQAGTQLDPLLVDAFLADLDALERIRQLPHHDPARSAR
jgi:response regulator RpfG family c-di-GMP phosphodiesterase